MLGQGKPRSPQKVTRESYLTTSWRTAIRTDTLLSEPPTHHKPPEVSGEPRGIPQCLWGSLSAGQGVGHSLMQGATGERLCW